ncbi:tail fiber assembly protein [Escherichia coli]|uniref:Tail fiber assembly protein n=1 Tax=Escherichia coli TaxID=562 RepID=A0A7L7EII3_ECOLX|nr:tail fiber assembly protein [Escherichia coli]EFD0882036.1 tail fiber assembly protein [Escherichia coli]EGU0173261.1 tail fiber assembly protein [Escherichia coli]ELJ9861665.1 tail fiber assembly protein [Escherichia coli]MBA8435508.1 tail fiber assembly protein [Escherichia coli]
MSIFFIHFSDSPQLSGCGVFCVDSSDGWLISGEKTSVNGTEEEPSLLEAWKKYRLVLNRVNTTKVSNIERLAVPTIK